MARSALFDRVVQLKLDRAREIVGRRLAEVAQRELDRAVEKYHPTAHRQVVDGVEGVPLTGAKEVVHFDFSYMRAVVQAALEQLESTSPVDSGAYVEAHSVFVNGVQVDDLNNIGMAQRVVITNHVPYARVIERGIGRHVPWSKQPQVPAEGVYSHAEKALRRRFGNVALIKFGWFGFEAGNETGSTVSKNRYPGLSIEAR
ncbi:hypothetical protein AZL_022060 [Azospirillum sp. B510]|uniref:hypothetical protein n=1 Tax=Azospirillum sp. (strain B510) TaxID=137722 RepID=UPI0001C4BEFB|nr:hypothetical protein [Azospirillum sp. B510]BAI72844.1 hypothetical protein AZL_022060 [Azospirillum sp. B510]